MFKKKLFKSFNFKATAFSVLLFLFCIISFKIFYNAAYSGTNNKSSTSAFNDNIDMQENINENELKTSDEISESVSKTANEYLNVNAAEENNIKKEIVNELKEEKTTEIKISEKNFSEENENYGIKIKYPYFNQAKIDESILKYINQKIDEFKLKVSNESGKKYLNINYSYNMYSEHIVSIVFKVEGEHEEYETFNFNVHNADTIKINDLFLGEYAYIFSGRIRSFFESNDEYKKFALEPTFKRYTNENPENYKNFTINDKYIVIYIDKSLLFTGIVGYEKIEFDLNSLKDYIKPYVYVVPEPNNESYTDDGKSNDKNSENEDMKRKIDKTKPMIALTFDDGPHPVVTGRILDKLKEYDAKATFFELGSRVDSYGDVTKRIVEEGNEIGSHTYDHKELTSLTVSQIQDEVDSSIDSIKNASGYYVGLVRPPYGSVNETVKKYVNYPLILWSVDTRDWESRNKDMVIENVLSTVKDGDIVLMHDIYTSTADACDVLIPELIKRGYQLVTVSELFENRDYDLINGGKYREAYKK